MASGAAGLLAVLLLLLVPSGDASIPTGEIDSMLAILRLRGYTRMSNSIATSDIRLDLLAMNSSVTVFAAPDRSLFALDMSLPSSAYLSVVRSHVAPRRFSLFDLWQLSLSASAKPIQTLLPGRSLHVASHYRFLPRGFVISIDCVELTVPGIYYGRHITVHGLRGSLPDLSGERHRSISRALPLSHRHQSPPRLSLASAPGLQKPILLTPIRPPSVIPSDQTISPHPDHLTPASIHLSTPIPSPAPNPQITSADLQEKSERTSSMATAMIRARQEELQLPKINNGDLEANIASRPVIASLKGGNSGVWAIQRFHGRP